VSDRTLVVLAAGLGRRFGGIKQVAAVDDAGHTLVDYGVFDAVRAGFDKVVCVVTPELEKDFHQRVGRSIARHVELAYAHQVIPAGRTKPWGTAEAVLVALPQVPAAFATVNADDFYGADAYQAMAAFLGDDDQDNAVVGYRLKNTMSEFGTVSRGVCDVGPDERLVAITERTALRPAPGGAVDQDGSFYPGDTLVSMNFWGFRADAARAFTDGFAAFVHRPDAAKAEYYLPDVGGTLVPHVKVLPTSATWMGVTYAADLPSVRSRIAEMIAAGEYPAELWP